MKVFLLILLVGASAWDLDDFSSSSSSEESSSEESGEVFPGPPRPETRYDLHYNEPALVNYINSVDSTWEAGYNDRFRDVRHEVIQGMLGTRLRRNLPGPYSPTRYAAVDIPDSFDSRTKWPMCKSISMIRDQSACGSCWAFGAVEAMSDRICIASGGKEQVVLSADDLLSCCRSCGMGCDGGEPIEAWRYWVEKGLVTGGNFTSHSGCKPYPFPPCEHHNNATHFRPCQHDLYPTPRCKHECQRSYAKNYEDDKYYGRRAFAIEARVEAIQKEIMINGPVEGAFEVYEDLLHYKSGVYQHHAGKMDGGHAIRIVGWGEENGTPYWLIANSWNTDWGMDGYFKILRGKDECGIESGCTSGTPKLNMTPKVFSKKIEVDSDEFDF